MTVAAAPPMTTEQMLALPPDGTDRWLIQGRLRERAMTVRNRWHSRIMVRVAHLLEGWLEKQPEPRGSVLCGEAGVRLRRDPDTTVGIDVIYISPEVAAQQPARTSLVEGVPTLVVEILSPSDTQEQIDEKIDSYLQAGVRVVWVIDPHDHTLLVYRPDADPEMVNARQELSGEPDLPGFRVPLAQLFQ
jgi:Uma2 family endonuclease